MAAAIASAEARPEPPLTDLEQRNLKAAARRVLPSDDGCGAREAGADEYVLRVVQERANAHNTSTLKSGLGMLEDLARQTGGKSFVELAEATQDQVLRQLQMVPHPTLQRFFRRLVALTLEGFLCDPVQGGNRQRVGWRQLGIEGDRLPEACLCEEPCTTS